MTGCASYSPSPSAGFDVEKINSNEVLGAGYEHLDGKLFHIFCGGNGYASYDFVKTSCMRNTAQFVHDNGYEYFVMLDRNGDVHKEDAGYILNGVYRPYTITRYSQAYIIFLITREQTEFVSKYYKVSDYYTDK